MNLLYSSIIIIIFLIITIIKHSYTLEDPGRTNPKYTIKNYYGSRHLSTFLSMTFIIDDPTIIKWSNGMYISESNNKMLFIADQHDQTIKVMNEDVINILVGKSQFAGFRNGDAYNVLFNKPSSVIFYNETTFPNANIGTFKPFLFKSSSSACLYATQFNYTACLNKEIANTSEKIDREMVKFIHFNPILSNSTIYLNFLFISDTDNHCIRRVNLITAKVDTYAGNCLTKGFKDGPIGINRFNQPKGIGMDDYGNVYVYDSGNRYMRMIEPNGDVKTLINGACYEYKLGYEIVNGFDYHSEDLICFRKWIKTQGEPSEHIYVKPTEEVCYEHIMNCPNYHTDLLYSK